MSNSECITILGLSIAVTNITLIWAVNRMSKLERECMELKHLIGIQKVNAKNG